jgi:hypothetical protein
MESVEATDKMMFSNLKAYLICSYIRIAGRRARPQAVLIHNWRKQGSGQSLLRIRDKTLRPGPSPWSIGGKWHPVGRLQSFQEPGRVSWPDFDDDHGNHHDRHDHRDGFLVGKARRSCDFFGCRDRIDFPESPY